MKIGLIAIALLATHGLASAQGMIESGGIGSISGGAANGAAAGGAASMSKLERFPGTPAASTSAAPSATSRAPIGIMGDDTVPSPAQRKQMASNLALVQAAFAGETWNVRAALNKGAKIETRDPQYGLTPLMWAATGGHVGTIRFLLERGAKVNAQSTIGIGVPMARGRSVDTVTDVTETSVGGVRTTSFFMSRRGGVTALMMAAANGWNLAARELLKHGANPNMTTPDGDAALGAAAFSGSVPLVKALLDKGAKINAVDQFNNSALFYAVMDGHAPVVRALLARGARANIVSRQGNLTPAGFARYRGFAELATLLDKAAKKEKPIPVKRDILPPPARSIDEVRILN